MMYYSILASFCLLGMASSQAINMLNACLTKEQNLKMSCMFTPKEGAAAVSCVFKMDKLVVATVNNPTPVDSTYKNRATATMLNNVCELTLQGFSADQPQTYNCTIHQGTMNVTMGKTVEKKNLTPCSDGNALKHSGVILLLAFILPLLSDML